MRRAMPGLRLRWPEVSPPAADQPASPWFVRLGWMAMIWAASLALLLGVAGVLRAVLL